MNISSEILAALRRLSTPTVSNAIEVFNARPRSEGFMSPEVRCVFPELGVMVGHAVTGRYGAKKPPAKSGSRYVGTFEILVDPLITDTGPDATSEEAALDNAERTAKERVDQLH